MKRILFLIIVAGMAMIISCKKPPHVDPTPPPPAPTLTINTPDTCVYAKTVVVSYSTTGKVDSVVVRNSITQEKVASTLTSFTTPSLTVTTTYTITAFGPGGSVTKQVSVTVRTQIPQIPTLTLSASPDTVWYAGKSTISWSTTNADSVRVNGIRVIGNTFITPEVTSSTTYSVTVYGPGGSVNKQITIYVWSQNMTFQCHYGDWKMVYNVSYMQADSLNPLRYNYLIIDSVNCKSNRYFTNNIAWIIQGCGNPIYTGSGFWYFTNNESWIHYGNGGTEDWKVDSLTTTILRMSREKPDPYNPSTIFHYVRRFIHP